MSRVLLTIVGVVAVLGGCQSAKPRYGTERQLFLPGDRVQVWAVAPAVNLSGIAAVDALLQADLVYQQLQTVTGLKVIPVNRVLEVYASLKLTEIGSSEQAALVCDLLGADALVVPTVTAFDPYNPPKMGASLQLFAKPGNFVRPAGLDPRQLARMAAPGATESVPADAAMLQVVGMYDATNGSVREKVHQFADGRNDPTGPLGHKEYFVSMDRFSSFVYHDLIEQLLIRCGSTF
ncbi:MAG: hypothetical protein NZ561_02250 [Phycisphaerae bacterium]|nr:hypothetical protein [Phycisphaerae bacterium]MDW8262557.1 hypothetical protein [Phycisphaerales bacterium]